MVNHGYSKRRIREEIERCVVLCANCHRKTHDETRETVPSSLAHIEESIRDLSGSRARQRRREWVTVYKNNSDGCTRCDVSSPICLDFHHENEKTDGIARLISQGKSLDAIRNEISNCVLLCANCHRKEHHGAVEENENR
jgi:cytochrome c553